MQAVIKAMEVNEIGNFSECCRLCLSEQVDTLKSIFDDATDDSALPEKIYTFLSIQIKSDDQISKMICDTCVDKVNNWKSFKELAVTNQQTLEKWHESIQSKDKPQKEILQAQSVPVKIKAEVVSDDDLEIIDFNLPVKAEIHDEPNYENNHQDLNNGAEVRALTNGVGTGDNPEQSRKLEFAAGLELFHSDSTPISLENLSKIESSYIEKCKAMITMYDSLVCACHNVSHPNLKGLLSHLRALRIWFPVFTCYNCMITYTDRSTSMKHFVRCSKAKLETLIKLSNLRKRSPIKTRLYQNYKCVQCKFMFSFHEDYCSHIDEDHKDPPYICLCQKTFENLEDYRRHVYVSCMIEFYCDICFVTTKTLPSFIEHAVHNHDESEGFVLLQNDGYKKKHISRIDSMPREIRSINSARSLSRSPEAPVVGKRRRSCSVYRTPVYDEPPLEPLPKKPKPATCDVCGKLYSNYANMLRHYKNAHLADPKTEVVNEDCAAPEDSLYRCPDCGFMYNSKEWEEHKLTHEQLKCSECDKIFLFQTELDQHRSVHLNLKVYRDSKTKSYKSTMLSPNSASRVCDICNIVCESIEDLEHHKVSHEDEILSLEPEIDIQEPAAEKKYYCKPCDKQYTGYSGLWEHNRRKHTDESGFKHGETYPRSCDECDKVVTSGAAYKKHKDMHRRKEQLRVSGSPPPSTHTGRSRSMPRLKRNISITQDDAEDYHTCKRCFKVFSTKSNLRNHMKLHGINMNSPKQKSPKKFLCEICDQVFTTTEKLAIHQDTEHQEDIPDYINVMEEFNNESYIFTCDICVQTFTSKHALKMHKEQHLSEVPTSTATTSKASLVYCKLCNIPFQTRELLNDHMATEHGENIRTARKKTEDKKFPCKICRKSFASHSAMTAHFGWHKRAEHGLKIEKGTTPERTPKKTQNNSQFQCSMCFMDLPNDTALQIHILEKHRNFNALIIPRCSPCNQEFETQQEYDTHKKLHDFVESQKKTGLLNKIGLQCNYCPATFSRQDTLNNHVRANHKDYLNGGGLKCPHCDRIFEKQSSFSNHIKMHERPKSMPSIPNKSMFHCSICNMGFNLPKDLRNHTINAHPF